MPSRWLIVILVAGFGVRLALAALAQHPGISDPNHYYNLAQSLVEGRGFVIDYIWQYHLPPTTVTHPIDYWMPLPAVWPALGITLLGNSLLAALLSSVVIGTLLALLTYGLAAAANLPEHTRLLAAGLIVFLPEFLLGSVRTDTVISYVLFASSALGCFYLGWYQRPQWFVLAGILGGLAQLSRQDGVLLLPAMLFGTLILWRWSGQPVRWRWLIALPIVWLVILSPWLLRNYQLFNALFPPGPSRTLYMTSFIDQFTYSRELNLEHYLAWGWPNILRNIVFHILANVKFSYTTLDMALPITALIGLFGVITQRDRSRLLFLVTPLLFILGLFVFYSILTPFHSMGGSYKKSYMVMIPFWAVISAWAIQTYITPRRVAIMATALIALFMLLNGIELIRADYNLIMRYNGEMTALQTTLNELGDVTGDARITVMAQDPFMLNYQGFYAVMMPSDDREAILDAASQYEVDYILLPADRVSMDALYNGVEIDERLPLVAVNGNFQLLGIAANQLASDW